jgi:hypothetical protein
MKRITITEQQNNNSFTLHDNDIGTILRSFTGFEYADVKESIDDVAGDYGSTYITSKFGRRRFSISGDLVGSDVFLKRRTLSTALRQTGIIKLVKFTTYDDLDLQCEAEVVKQVNPYNHKVHTFLIEMVAPDWRFYSQEEIMQQLGVTVVPGGTDIPFEEIPVSIDATPPAGTEVTNIIINEGNEVTDPILKLYGPGTTFIMENITTGDTLTLSATIVEGDEVEINVKERTVIKNGVTNLYPDLTGDFWSLAPGENELRFFVNSGDEVGITKLEVIFRHAYSGI